jgi:hypothetical protein
LTSDSAHIIPNATLYHFGVLTSGVHMAWVRVVCGRLKSDYRYSKDIVYNNFPWPETGREQKDGISGAAKEVLDAREMFPGASLADLYDPLTMPPKLWQAHQALDRLVRRAYGFPAREMEGADCVARLMERYRKLAEAESG